MMKQILKLSILLLLFVPWQKVAGQEDIIMGTTSFVGDIDDQSRSFYDPGGTGYFAQGLNDTLTLRTNINGTQLYVLFEEFAMGDGDTLWLFDGDASQCDIDHMIGYYNLVNSPGEQLATGRVMTFVFHSDSMDIPGLQNGWMAKVYAYDPVAQQINYGEYTTVLTCNAMFYDAGGPNGNINANGTPANSFTEFTSPIGTHVKCEFSQFSVGGVLKIYDGQYNDPNKRLIGQFCTSTLDAYTGNKPPTLFSSGNTLSFSYAGGSGDASKAGWSAVVSCVPELFESEDGNPCPSITNVPGGLYADSPNPKVIEFDCSKPVVLLQANVIATGQYTSDYKVEQIPYDENNMLFAYNEGTSIGASSDDSWLSGVPLPFTFIFFGKPYTTVYPGTNGLISMTPQSGYCTYSYNAPSATPPYSSIPYVYKNCVYGVYEDIDCRYYTNKNDGLGNGAVRVGVLGQYPCRAFVFNYLNVGLFGLTSTSSGSQYNNYNTYQMVLYEGTNIIDVYVKHRKCCATTNSSGEGIIGLHNNTSSQILLAPGRGMTSWSTDNEAWRFTPITPLDENGSLTWYINSIADTNIISYDPHAKNRIITVSPSDTTVYISEYRYTNAVGDLLVLYDTTVINVNIPKISLSSSNGNVPVCPGDSVFLTMDYDNTLGVLPMHYEWSTGDTLAIDTVAPAQTKTYSLIVTFDNGCTQHDTVQVKVTELEMPTITGMNSATDIDSICIGDSYSLTVTHPTSNNFQWSTGQTTPSITITPQVTKEYVVSATMEGNCIVTDTFTVVVLPLPNPAFIASPTEIFVENGIGTVYCTNISNGNYPHLIWNFGDVFSNVNIIQDVNDPAHDYTRSGYYTITLTAVDSFGCVDSIKTRVSVSVPFFFYIPNAFTPDGDGINETFAPKGEGVDPDHYSMQIFDRSGMLIFTTRNPYDYWDGRNKHGQMCPEGVYVYKILLLNLNEEDKEYTGTVTLVR